MRILKMVVVEPTIEAATPEVVELVDIPVCRIPAGGGVDEFFMAQTPITNKQYATVMPHTYPAGQDDYPVVDISWEDAKEFCERASEALGREVSLPTEFEWCWAVGKEPARNELEKYAVFGQTSDCPVKTKLPNEYGLYDMRGLVWEWLAVESDEWKVLRGGAWYRLQLYARAVYRSLNRPADRDYDIGFRVVVDSFELEGS